MSLIINNRSSVIRISLKSGRANLTVFEILFAAAASTMEDKKR